MAHYKVKTSHGTVEFDADRSDLSKQDVEDVINEKMGKKATADKAPEYDRLGESYRDAFETTGMMAGGLAAGIPGAGLGRSAGTQVSSLIDQLRGRAKPAPMAQEFMNAGKSAVVGAAAEMGGQLAGKYVIQPAVEGVAKAVPRILQATGHIPRPAGQMIAEGGPYPKGSPSEIQGGVQDVIGALKTAKERAGQIVQAAKEKLGIAKPLQDRVDELPFKAKIAPLEKIVESYKALKQGPAATAGMSEKQLLGMRQAGKLTTEEYVNAIGQLQGALKTKNLSTVDRIQELIHLRQAIDDRINFAKPMAPGGAPSIPSEAEGTLRMMAKDVNGMLDQIKEAQPLRSADKVYANARQVYDRLQKAMETPGKAEEFLYNTYKGDSPTDKENLSALHDLEKISGQPVIKNLFKQFSGREVNKTFALPSIRATMAGLSLFALRSFGIPPQVTLPAAILSQSPKALSKIVAPTLDFARGMGKNIVSSGISLLERKRQRDQDENSSPQ